MARSVNKLVWCPGHRLGVLVAFIFIPIVGHGQETSRPARDVTGSAQVSALAREVAGKGWIAYSAVGDAGDWDIFLMRPDGSDRRNITQTRDAGEAGARFSPDGTRLLYYRVPAGEPLDNNTYGTHTLVLARADGSEPKVLGDGLPWATWSPDGRRLACLARDGIKIIDPESREVIRKFPRKGMVEQLVWSPDGDWFVGTANGLGEHWAIGRMNAMTGELIRVSDGDCFNCTPDWFSDSRRVVYSKGHPKTEGWAQLWMASSDGEKKRMIVGEIGRHLYGGAISPDGRYVLFTRSSEDLGKVDHSSTTMALVRFEDTPIILGPSEPLRNQYPTATSGPMLDLGPGWEPHWNPAPDHINLP